MSIEPQSARLLRAALMLGSATIAFPVLAQTPGSAAVQPDPAARTATETQPATPAPGPAVQAAAAPAPSEAQTRGVADIIVTAQKREQNLQKVPISITALSQATILANRIQDVRDLSALAPNLTVRLGAGGGLAPNYTLRGILAAGTAAGVDKGVSLYIDGVYVQSVAGSAIDIAEIERIEVLKGPQGTLFGRNATGGAISIITRNPPGKFGIKQDLTYGNYDQFRSKTRVDTPTFGPLSATFTYLHSERRGDIRNSGAGARFNYAIASGGKYGIRKSAKYLGDNDTNAFAATVKADLFDGLDLIYKFDYAKVKYTPDGQGLAYLSGPASVVGQLYAGSPNARTPITRSRPDAVNNEFTTRSDNKVFGHALTARYRLNDQVSFKNILSYRKTSLFSTFQLDGLGGLRTQNVTLGQQTFPVAAVNPNTGLRVFTPGVPFEVLANNVRVVDKQWSEEFQVNINTEWFNTTAGYLHFDDDSTQQGAPNLYNTSVLQPIAGQFTSAAGTPFVLPRSPGYRPTNVKVRSDAFFVQHEQHLTDKLDLVLGVRITKDIKNGREFAPDQVAAVRAANPVITVAAAAAGLTSGAIAPVSAAIRYRDSEATYLAGLNYQITPRILGYAKYSTGYISGGQIATIQFDPERASSYEAGVKTDLFDRRLRSNFSAFYVNYKSIQVVTSGLLTGVAAARLYSTAIVSAADARAYGFEWENTIVPTNGVTLTANVGYTNFKYDQSSVFFGFKAGSGAPGYQAIQRPKWTGNVAAQYESPDIFHGGHLFARLDANFRSKMLLSSDVAPGAANDPSLPNYNPAQPIVLISQVPGNAALRRASTTPFQWIVNGRLALSDLDFGSVKGEVALWSRNMLNNRRITQFVPIDLGPLGAFGSVIYERARTFGIDVSVAF